MRRSESLAHPSDRKLREFAAAGAIVCAALAVWRGLQGDGFLVVVSLVCAVVVVTTSIVRPHWLAPLFTIAMVATFPLAWAVSWLVLALLFYGVLTPIGILLRLLRRDPLKRTLSPTQDSYWEAKPAADSPRRYFRQF